MEYTDKFSMPIRMPTDIPKNDVRWLKGQDLQNMSKRIVEKWLNKKYSEADQPKILETISENIFYFDMDGTCSEWNPDGNWQAKHYFLHRYPIWNVLDAARILDAYGFTVRFGTCVIDKDAFNDKRIWKNALGCEHISILGIPYGANKNEYLVGDKRILIDDYTPNLLSFEGKTVKLLNGINNKKKQWTGNCVHKKWEPSDIVEYLLNVAV